MMSTYEAVRRRTALTAALLSFLLLSAVGAQAQSSGQTMPQTMPMTGMDHSKMPGMGPSGAASPAVKAYQAAMAKMHKDMTVKPTGNPDVDFAQGMVPHHQGAIDMAKVELQYGTDPQMRKLAQDVIAAQDKEIAFMQSWLAQKH